MSRYWLRVHVALVFALALVGCDDGAVAHAPPRVLEHFEYQLQNLNPVIDPTFSMTGVLLEMDGTVVGRYRDAFKVARATTLEGAKLALRVPTNCGDVRVPVRAQFRAGESRHREWIAAGGGSKQILFDLRRDGDWPAQASTVYIDNTRSKISAVVKIGEQELTVDAGRGTTLSLAIGPCAHARRVTIGKHTVGELPRGYQTTLIDVLGGSCYVYETTTYAAETAAGVPAAPPRSYIRMRPGQHLVEARAARFLSRNPKSIVVYGSDQQVRNAVRDEVSLNPLPCSAVRSTSSK